MPIVFLFILSNVNHAQQTAALKIQTQPHARMARVGESVSFSVRATGHGLKYQWFCDAEPIDAANGSNLTLPYVRAIDHGAKFSVRVTNEKEQ